MNDDKNVIQETIRAVRKLHEDMALLLRTAESQMGEEGWESGASRCIRDSSIHIPYPDRWMPFHRFNLVI